MMSRIFLIKIVLASTLCCLSVQSLADTAICLNLMDSSCTLNFRQIIEDYPNRKNDNNSMHPYPVML